MVHVKLRDDPGANIRVVYLVDAAVGRAGSNRRDDVLLVQFFLNAMWNKLIDKAKKKFGGPGVAPPIDGICGGITIGAIEAFQRWYWEQPAHGGFTDGRVEPLPPGQVFGPRHHQVYTIIGLNVNFGFTFGVDRHARIAKEPNFPQELRQKLFV
ncbi:MAG TPA: hypothetical protein VJQ81_09415 [Reyranella sp.]|jgi:hypothetical protein|nr:hypothetical protein [Reyranella sp.]